MGSLFEVQSSLARSAEDNVLPCRQEGGDALLLEAERVWGGPLPGIVIAIQTEPLRCEISGLPPVRLLKALRMPMSPGYVESYWQLKVRERRAAVYHWRNEMVPMPALPAGVNVPSSGYPGCRNTVDWDTGEVLQFRLYVTEWVEGRVAEHFADLVPEKPASMRGRIVYTAYGLDYGADLRVVNINRYDVDLDTLKDHMLVANRVRMQCLHGVDIMELVGCR